MNTLEPYVTMAIVPQEERRREAERAYAGLPPCLPKTYRKITGHL
jgi:hypothetical protein